MCKFHFGRILGQGMERICYENTDNPCTCFKVSSKEHCKQTLREGAYFKYLRNRNIFPSFMPKFIGLYETEDSYIIEQELIQDTKEIKTQTLRDFILHATDDQMNDLQAVLVSTFNEMLALNIIVSDMRTTNIFVLSHHGVPYKLVIFDGYGAPEFIPFPNYIRFFGERKIKRQLKKFKRYYEEDLKKRLDNAS